MSTTRGSTPRIRRAFTSMLRGRHTVSHLSEADNIIFILRTQVKYGRVSDEPNAQQLKKQCNDLILILCKALKTRLPKNWAFTNKLFRAIKQILVQSLDIPRILSYIFTQMRGITKDHRSAAYNRFDEEYLASDLVPVAYLSEASSSDSELSSNE